MSAIDYYLRSREEKEQEFLKSRPVCECCGEPIQEDAYYDLDGEILCKDCLNERYRKFIDD